MRTIPPGLPDPGRCLVMGVVNVTPDSFSDGGAWFDPEAAIRHGLELSAAIEVALGGLQVPGADPSSSNGSTQQARVLGADALEVAVLDRSRDRRTFRRISREIEQELDS